MKISTLPVLDKTQAAGPVTLKALIDLQSVS